MYYESHLTVDAEHVDLSKFKHDCQEMGVKPLLIALQEHTKLAHVMTSSTKQFDNDKLALDWASEQVVELNSRGYKVVRVKIEAEPHHPMAPQTADAEMPAGCYFETHVKITLIDPEVEGVIRELAKEHNVHLSRNAFKIDPQYRRVFMLTYRSYDQCLKDFKDSVEAFLLVLQNSSSDRISLGEKVITEFAMFDTNVAHDNEWLAV